MRRRCHMFVLDSDGPAIFLRLLPLALIPLWGVPITGALSLIALHRCLTERTLEGVREA